jgi:hypothetical protein
MFTRKFNSLIIVLFICSFFAAKLYSNEGYESELCNFPTSEYLEELNKVSSVNNLEININNYKKWAKNQLSILKSDKPLISRKYKKKFNANVKIHYNFGICTFQAEVRQHGDLRDHIEFTENGSKISQSLDVKILNGSLFGFTKFKLYLPRTRNFLNEIIATNLFRELNIIAPSTYLMNTTINGTSQTMLIQEKVAKEMLEKLHLRENPIFEGDESLIWGNGEINPFELEDISLSRFINPSWIDDSKNKTMIGLDSFALLQDVYLEYSNNLKKQHFLNFFIISNGNDNLVKKWAKFEIVLLALNGIHGLRPHNRKFYFNSFENGFEPIYFDGNTNIQGRYFKEIPNFNYSYYNDFHFDYANQSVNKIDKVLLRNAIQSSGAYLELSEVEEIIDDLQFKISELKRLFNNSEVDSNKVHNFSYRDAFITRVSTKIPNAKIFNLDTFIEDDFISVEVCNLLPMICTPEKLKMIDIQTLLSSKSMQFGDTIIFKNKLDSNHISTEINDLSINYEFNSNFVKIFHDHENRFIRINYLDSRGWVLFKNSDFSNYEIEIQGELPPTRLPQDIINLRGLSGCITFYNSKFLNTSIKSDINGACEDVINFVDSHGEINDIYIKNSLSDAIDADFSNLIFRNIYVQHSSNDCLDLSFGIYEVDTMYLEDCGDKGFSIGEGSKVKANKISINKANIGIAPKDSSILRVNSLFVQNTKFCINAYQKKIEFNGSLSNLISSECNGGIIKSDSMSSINILNEL